MNERDEELARSIDPDAWRQLHKDDMSWCQQFADLIRADERTSILNLVELYAGNNKDLMIAIKARGIN